MANNTDLKTLHQKRGAIKGVLTRFVKHLDKIKVEESLNEADIIELELRINKVDSLLGEFETIQLEIEILEPTETDSNEWATFEQLFYSSVASARKLLENFKDRDDAQSNHSGRSASSAASRGRSIAGENQNNVGQDLVKLPTIKLPKFNGDYRYWLEFRDTYLSLIHNNGSIGEMQKFHYLRASVEGAAAQAIYSIKISAQNYEVAWKVLCERYDNKKLLVRNHIKSLLHNPKMSKESSLSLRLILDNISKNLHALTALGLDIANWDSLIIFIVSEGLDYTTAREWEEVKVSGELATLEEFKAFLKGKAEVLESLEVKQTRGKDSNIRDYKQKTFVATEQTCVICEKDHSVFNCNVFQKMSVDERSDKIRELKLCINCFKRGHIGRNCRTSGCRHCNGKHNTLLHFPRKETSKQEVTEVKDEEKKEDTVGHNPVSTCNFSSMPSQTLLSTAYVQVQDSSGNVKIGRALLDSGSQSNFITEKFSESLRLSKDPINFSIVGIGNVEANIKLSCDIKISSLHYSFSDSIRCLVIKKITDKLPSVNIKRSTLRIPGHLRLADPEFDNAGEIDILLGAGVFWKLMCVGQVRIENSNLVAQKTKLGWVISGIIGGLGVDKSLCHFSKNSSIQNQLEKFWQVEEVRSPQVLLSKEEVAAEQCFQDTFQRNCDGRFVVSLPLKGGREELGDSRRLAEKRFLNLERKLKANSDLKEMYVNFMSEYEQLGHMSRVSNDEQGVRFYLPHHGVMKEDSSTTKLRVVFDASAKSQSGYSLNDLLMVGPKIQDDLFDILLRYRKHKYAVCADIAKMYRQVQMNKKFTELQCILWRSDPAQDIGVYRLETVTYGTSAASFLAIRCLKQLSIENEREFPLASSIIAHDFYVDDLLTGGNTIKDTVKVCNQVSDILKAGCFELRKWCSNSSEVLNGIHGASKSSELVQFGTSENTKTLGLLWSCKADTFTYKINANQGFKSVTKRNILSEIAQVFDPLGLVAPCTVTAKIILQKLWMLGLSWDESITGSLYTEWVTYRKELNSLNSLEIPRFVLLSNYQVIECHCFADASQKAYGGCIYLRCINKENEIQAKLLCAKSRVAPLKTLSIPRLELCAAVITTRLFQRVSEIFGVKFDKVFFWTDSSIVLAWINSEPHSFNPFVGNRITEIQTITKASDWYHISSGDNPADVLSRGISPSLLPHNKTWWYGPSWLVEEAENWPLSPLNIERVELSETRKIALVHQVGETLFFPFDKFSSFTRVKRVMAYCLRFVENCRVGNDNRKGNALSTSELEIATLRLVKIAQQCFSKEVKDLKKNNCVANNSKLLSLSPFLDENEIIRVGGRLRQSDLAFDQKHQMILAKDHPLTSLIFRYEHERSMHCGAQLLLCIVRGKFWPVSGKNLARKTVHACVKCTRFKSNNTAMPLMGDLPAQRISPMRPFTITGVDYAGPFTLRDKKGRGYKTIKSYICLFVCFTTKAIHLELVSELTKEAFIATLRRFVARRGKPSDIYSDNGSNFVGSNTSLKELGKFIVNNYKDISCLFANEDIAWHFIPAYSPHFGGLWEAGVKSTKFHLKRVLSNALLTFEDFYTVLTQIESVLNSRPLTPISSDPKDLEPLTPAHFLIGRPPATVPEPDVHDVPDNRLTQFERLQKLHQHFWMRWSAEYLNQLQQRSKWRSNRANLEVGALVLVKERHLPPGRWILGRVLETHPGADSVVRVVSVKTQGGVVKRSVARVCLLPIETNSK